ncbi:dienelactone hydrolase family protein [Fimbriimonas ginsengisoli]|uniref:Dienelactone hydrolase n=1 Tax=Fimbriimonas ginsengisoli Gsoil 348 TaxID=661478 RepID=A0A068NJQ4_FIMGI|nr:dienelactone hydrolase family protein [Fimbriimonas ginsengisoli]AIE83682.1 Dienelactone hydrolase [Fimbriimonas ginsengisoli Gsoil 348]
MSFAFAAAFIALTIANPATEKPSGYLAEPKSGHGHGVLVLHPWWGLNGDVKAFCRRLAATGFVAFAPDLFHGKIAKTREEAKALVQAHESKAAELKAQIGEAAKYLANRTGHEQIGVVGFSFGSYYALWFSNAEPERVKATVVYYGTGQEDFTKSKASYLGHFAEKDEFEPKAGVDALSKLLKDAGRPATIYTYPGTGHWFVEPSVKQAYNKAAAELAWKRTVRFLRTNLDAK